MINTQDLEKMMDTIFINYSNGCSYCIKELIGKFVFLHSPNTPNPIIKLYRSTFVLALNTPNSNWSIKP